MDEYRYFYKNEDEETLTLTTNFETTPPKEMIYNYKKYYLVVS